MKKVICIKDPNPDYKNWIYKNLEIEVDSLPIYIGGIYTTNEITYKNKCWGKKQEYIYISEMIEFGSFPRKYFSDYEIWIDGQLKMMSDFPLKPIYLN